ncbi:MAG: hypothetical protein ACI8PZ_005804 [Myxococcota bacterium]|jgi:hypothetical protein
MLSMLSLAANLLTPNAAAGTDCIRIYLEVDTDASSSCRMVYVVTDGGSASTAHA